MKKLVEVEYLRAVAIIFTLIQHLGLLFMPSAEAWAVVNKNNPYWGGVDLFFCISGFVISRRMVDSWSSMEKNRVYWAEVLRFWIRRFFRIVPTLALWVGLSLVCSVWFNYSGAFGPIWPNIYDSLAAIFNYSNFHIFNCVMGYSQCGPNPVYWSLSLEEQFYLLLPLLFLLPANILKFIIGAAVIFQLFIHRMPWEQSVGGALWFVRTDALLLGVLLAFSTKSYAYSRAAEFLELKRLLSWTVAVVLIIALSLIPRSGAYLAAGGIAVVSFLLVTLASFDRGLLAPRDGRMRWASWIGGRSFSIYLVHLPVSYMVNEIAYRISGQSLSYKYPLPHSSLDLVYAFTVLISVLVIAELNYRLVETPLRRIGVTLANNLGRKRLNSSNVGSVYGGSSK